MTTEQIEPMTDAGKALLADEWWTDDETHIAFVRQQVVAAERGAIEACARLVDEVIFDLPIGNDVTYSRGYSAGVAAARESLRRAITEGIR